MHRRSSGSPVEDGVEDTPVSRTSTEEGHGANGYETPEKSRSQVARRAASVDLRRENSVSTPRSRTSSTWRNPPTPSSSQPSTGETKSATMIPLGLQRFMMEVSPDSRRFRQSRWRSPWSCSIGTLFVTFLGMISLLWIVRSFTTRQVGTDGCDVPMMSPTFIKMVGFDTEHTRFASKYKLYLYREEGVDAYSQENIGVWNFLRNLFVGSLI